MALTQTDATSHRGYSSLDELLFIKEPWVPPWAQLDPVVFRTMDEYDAWMYKQLNKVYETNALVCSGVHDGSTSRYGSSCPDHTHHHHDSKCDQGLLWNEYLK